ncbi:MAG TPA: hypothetical protein DEE98_03925 [Elusimicrobia bacterium]|nr:MAG: hypothetical protein A2278_06925 [Elusimicrobia bacterium RIFOXYA12_FULL_49_49]OGS16226.1 MAG: hypothetical protein A2251_01260 [Elusimicrobia bacterium RIFOXYA2_FULL_47_53]OGS26231.1 MAG: hypothetical protein A2339_02835 [Elusimicrobia bacterium RIFOXYB12_FULL_50_12]OGS31381.1 MAG: hypothetical protein A2323_09550 [Elusimicrobia bacterium RIFOXYB2_FULL_46_23]HBU69515.1 hypothetical protein [Elusimicrobiota bacterium]
MEATVVANAPFHFYTRLHLTESTGIRICNLNEMVAALQEVPGSCIYHHTHKFLQQHEYLSPEPPNDFAFWAKEALGDDVLSEKLSSIDIIQFKTIRALREKIVSVMKEHMSANSYAADRCANPGKEFWLLKSVSFIIPTSYVANNLAEFARILEKITINSIYFHIFEARLRLEKESNDFSNWIADSIGDKELADMITRLDPYTYALEDLRRTVIKLIKKRM